MQSLSLVLLLLTSPSSPQGPANWKAFPVGGGATASFPEQPKLLEAPLMPGMVGAELRACAGLAGSFVAIKALFKDANVQREVWEAGTIDGMVGGEYDRLVEEKESLINGWPVLDLTVKKDDGTLVGARAIKVDKFVVQLLATYGAPRPKSVDRFLDSLNLPVSLGKGPLSSIGPVLKMYDLGDSGISAQFPHKPELAPAEDAVKGKNHFNRYSTFYVNCTFEAGYGTIPPQQDLSENKPVEVLNAFCADLATEMGGAIHDEELKTMGSDTTATFGLDLDHGKRSKVIATLRGRTIACAIATGPKIFAETPEFSDFLHSLKFKR